MKLHLLVVGRTVDKYLDALIADYAARIKHYMPFELEVIPELKNAKSLTTEGDHLVLLDEGGREFRSIEWAAHLEQRQAGMARRMVFVVGGPYGFSPAVYAAAREKLSLSRMTFSHQMVRLFMVEQLYRAMTILRGEPYHHE